MNTLEKSTIKLSFENQISHGSVGIYSTYEISILGCMLINYVTSVIVFMHDRVLNYWFRLILLYVGIHSYRTEYMCLVLSSLRNRKLSCKISHDVCEAANLLNEIAEVIYLISACPRIEIW